MQHNHLSIFNVVVGCVFFCFRSVRYSCHCGLFLDGSELTLVSTSGTKPATRHVTLRPKPSSGNMSGRKMSWNEGCEEGTRRSCSSNDNNKTLIKRPCEQRNGQFQHVFGKLERFGPLNFFLHRKAVLNRLISKPWCEK